MLSRTQKRILSIYNLLYLVLLFTGLIGLGLSGDLDVGSSPWSVWFALMMFAFGGIIFVVSFAVASPTTQSPDAMADQLIKEYKFTRKDLEDEDATLASIKKLCFTKLSNGQLGELVCSDQPHVRPDIFLDRYKAREDTTFREMLEDAAADMVLVKMDIKLSKAH